MGHLPELSGVEILGSILGPPEVHEELPRHIEHHSQQHD